MNTNTKQFMTRLEDQAFKAAFESAEADGRQKLLEQAGLGLSLAEAEAILANLSSELGEDDLQSVAGGNAGVILPPPGGDD